MLNAHDSHAQGAKIEKKIKKPKTKRTTNKNYTPETYL